jgi:O-antigen/teichoic acid export membrane protein
MRFLSGLPQRIARRPRVKASLTVLGGNVAGAAAAFAAAIVAARVLEIDEFAAFGVGLAVHSLAVQFGDFGLGTVAVAETADLGGSAAARAKLRSLLLHRMRTALAVALLAIGVVFLLPPLEPYRAAAAVGAGGEVFGVLAYFLIWSLQGARRFAAAGALQGLQGALRLLLVGACAIAGSGAVPMMVGYAVLAPLATALVGAALLFARSRHGDADVAAATAAAPSVAEIDIRRRRTMAVTAAFSAMVINGDVLLLAMLASEPDVASYTAAWRFSSGVLLANTAIASAMLPFIVTAADAWGEAKLLVRRGLALAAGWVALLPLMAIVGPLLLGSIGEDARTPLIILLVAFALDGFYFAIYQIYLRVRRERLLLAIALLELLVMATVTVLLRDEGASAPAFGQLAARVVACLVVVAPIVLAVGKRCGWFDIAFTTSCKSSRA